MRRERIIQRCTGLGQAKKQNSQSHIGGTDQRNSNTNVGDNFSFIASYGEGEGAATEGPLLEEWGIRLAAADEGVAPGPQLSDLAGAFDDELQADLILLSR